MNALVVMFRSRVGDLFSKVSSPKLHGQYAKAREVDGQYREAARAYEAAKEFDSAVRLVCKRLYLSVKLYDFSP